MSEKIKTDKNFDGLAKRFAKNIYGSAKGDIREAVLWRDLQPLLESTSRPLRILDAGGGQGHFSRRLAVLGHHVVLVDHSKEMLAIAEQEITAAKLSSNISVCHSSIQDYTAQFLALHQQPFDLVLCHAVIEWLAEPKQTFMLLPQLLKKGGSLSLLFYNKTGLLFQSLVVGNFDYVARGLKKGGRRQRKLTPQMPHEIAEVQSWVKEAQLQQQLLSGIRCIHDYMRLKEHQNIELEQIIEMELAYSQHPAFMPLGRYIHLLAIK